MDKELDRRLEEACKDTTLQEYKAKHGEVKTDELFTVELECSQNGKPLQSIKNAENVLEHDRELRERICFNELSQSPYVCGGVPWDHKHIYREWTDHDDSFLLSYMERKYDIRSKDKIFVAIDTVSKKNSYNPLIEHLERLPEWDHKPHIENLLPTYLGVEKTPYNTAVMELFMRGAISRVYEPGIKFDYVPILVGSQGCGKSTFIRQLAMNDLWFDDNFSSMAGKEALEKLRGKWIVEIAELLAMKNKAKIEGIKSFITSRTDVYRESYGRRTIARPRLTVFIGTTNDDTFLSDMTGNRRFLPIVVGKDKSRKMFTEQETFKAEIEMAWAEALWKYRNDNQQLIMPDTLAEEVERIQQEHTEEDVRVGIIQEWLDHEAFKERFTGTYGRVSALHLWDFALGMPDVPKARDTKELNLIMRNKIKGWKHVGVQRTSLGTFTCFERED